MYGRHLIRCYSKTQATIALSSAEAELGEIVKISAELLGLSTLMADLGISLEEKANTAWTLLLLMDLHCRKLGGCPHRTQNGHRPESLARRLQLRCPCPCKVYRIL